MADVLEIAPSCPDELTITPAVPTEVVGVDALNQQFAIGPQGPKGDTGPQGPTGPQGIPGRGAVPPFVVLIGDGTTCLFEVQQPFGTRDVLARVIEDATGQPVFPDVSVPDDTYVRVVFADPPEFQQYRVVVTI